MVTMPLPSALPPDVCRRSNRTFRVPVRLKTATPSDCPGLRWSRCGPQGDRPASRRVQRLLGELECAHRVVSRLRLAERVDVQEVERPVDLLEEVDRGLRRFNA